MELIFEDLRFMEVVFKMCKFCGISFFRFTVQINNLHVIYFYNWKNNKKIWEWFLHTKADSNKTCII